MTDFIFADHGSITILTPRNDAAQEWLDENVGDDARLSFGGGVVIEPRYAAPILEGLMDSGFTVRLS
jgi:hypothetical protein